MTSRTDLPARALAFAEENGTLPRGARVLCALSGGADSMALLTCLLALAEERDLTVSAAHYNHRLRGEESQRDEAFAADWCRQAGVPLTLGSGDVAGEAARAGKGIEETAREMRYAFLQKAAAETGADCIATAHNADDNAETVLLHLVRGTGLDGLTGIPPVRGNLVRPLLCCTRAEIEDYLRRENVPHVEDSTNADPTYARNRIRREVLPVLRTINPGFVRTLSGNLPHLRADRDYLYARAEELSRAAVPVGEGLSLSAAALAAAPKPVAIRAVRQILGRLDRWQSAAVHLEGVLALANGPDPAAVLPLPEGLTVRREYDTLLFSPTPPNPAAPGFSPATIDGPGSLTLENGWRVTVEEAVCPTEQAQGRNFCHLRPPPFPLTLRPRRTGDILRLPGRNTKTLKKWCIDEKIPRPLRDSLPVLTAGDAILAAAGLGPDEAWTARPGEPSLHIKLIPPVQ